MSQFQLLSQTGIGADEQPLAPGGKDRLNHLATPFHGATDDGDLCPGGGQAFFKFHTML